MNRFLVPALLAGLIAAGSAHAQQAAPADAGKERPRAAQRDCSKAPDPKACEERREKLRAAGQEARKACEGKQGNERRECMTRSMCAKAPDPARCETRAKERAEKMKERREKRGDGAKS